MEYLSITPIEFKDIISVFAERDIEIMHSVQDGEVRIYSHIDEVEHILWSARVVDGLEAIFSPKMAVDAALIGAKTDSSTL